jgi:cytochrome P450
MSNRVTNASVVVAAPSHVPEQLVVSFDHVSDPRFLADPLGAFDRLRQQGPILYSDQIGGFWLFTDPEIVKDAISDIELFSNRQSTIPPYAGPPMVPTQLDPPEHAKYRKLVIPYFSSRSMAEKSDLMKWHTRQLLDRLEDGAVCDFVADFARPLPAAIFASLCDLPEGMGDTILGWVHGMDRASTEHSADSVFMLREYMSQVIHARRASDSDDLLSVVARSVVDGEPISRQMAENMAFVLTLGGLDTTSGFLSVAWHYLAQHPEQRERLLATPESLATGLEELLRAFTIVNITRTVARDMEWRGVELKEGEVVLLCLTSANRSLFGSDGCPHEGVSGIDLQRPSNPHMAFGLRNHRCVGMHLARRELEIAVVEWHKRFPDYELAPEPTSYFGGGVFGFARLPLKLGASRLAVTS